ncbi:putative permease YjgP/YjgQ family protein [compost metagenome]
MKLLDRYILSELIPPFAFGVAAFTGIMTASTVLFHLVTLMVRHGLPIGLVLEILGLRLPEMVFYTFPMSMLLASLLAFGRLSGDGEITAFKAAGVSLYRMMAPVIAFAVFVSGATIALNEVLVPAASWQAKRLLYEATHKQELPVARDHLFYNEMADGQLKRLFYARRFDGHRMQDVVVQEFEDNKLVRIVQAAEAAPTESGWRFAKGVVYQTDEAGEYRFVVKFDAQQIALGEALLALSRENRQPMEMNASELNGHIERLVATGQVGREINELRVQWHQKFAVPFASLVFALVGAPMGLRPNRSNSSIGLGVSILVIFIYYILMFVCMAMGQIGALPAVLGAWLPNVVAASIGGYLLLKQARQ